MLFLTSKYAFMVDWKLLRKEFLQHHSTIGKKMGAVLKFQNPRKCFHNPLVHLENNNHTSWTSPIALGEMPWKNDSPTGTGSVSVGGNVQIPTFVRLYWGLKWAQTCS